MMKENSWKKIVVLKHSHKYKMDSMDKIALLKPK